MAEPRYIASDFFVYEADFTGLAAGGTQSVNVTVQADSNFSWEKSSMMADIAGAAQTVSGQVIPLCTVSILIGSSGRNLMSAAVPVFDIFGTGQIPFVLPRPRILEAQTIFTVTVTNYSAATTYNLRLSFIGSKLFRG